MAWEISFLNALDGVACPLTDHFLAMFTYAGDNGYVWIALALFLLSMKQTRKTGMVMLGALLLMQITGNMMIKPFVARVRPFVAMEYSLRIHKPGGFSFPSGHTASSVAAAAVFTFYHKRHSLGVWVLAVLIAFSRMYFYVHYPTDVLGGVVLGFACAALAVWMAEKKVPLWVEKRQRT